MVSRWGIGSLIMIIIALNYAVSVSYLLILFESFDIINIVIRNQESKKNDSKFNKYIIEVQSTIS